MKTERSTPISARRRFVPKAPAVPAQHGSRPGGALVPLLGLSMLIVACNPISPGEADPTTSISAAVLNPGNGVGTGGGGGGSACYLDLDGDGHGWALSNHANCNDPGYSTDGIDCDDGNAHRWQQLDCYTDGDRDGLGVGSKQSVCAGRDCASVGMAAANGDCDDSDASVAGSSIDCYADADGDHYGQGHVIATCASSCFAVGRAESAGDCDDSDPNIHPHRLENANGVDDDCDGTPDQARPMYRVAGYNNTSTSFDFEVAVVSGNELAALTANNLWAKVYYRKLEDASSAYQTTALMQAKVALNTATVTVSGLEPLKVYEARIDFFKQVGSVWNRIRPLGSCVGDSSNTPPCSNSGVYYTITLPSGSGVLKNARAAVVLNGLYEFDYFRTHSLGRWDDSLKNRYQLKADDTAYCSEFYSNAAEPYLKDFNPCSWVGSSATPQCKSSDTSPAEATVAAMKTRFGTSWEDFGVDPDFNARLPGDYLGVNESTSYPNGQHSQMFLAFDAASGQYWYVEGNGSYSNNWGPLAHTVNVESHGRCDSGGLYCPSSAAGICAGGCFWVRSVGKIDDTSMVDP